MCQSSFAEDIIINPCERWQIKTTGIKVHHIITWKISLPSPTFFEKFFFFTFFLIFLLPLVRFCPPSSCHVNLKIPLHPEGGSWSSTVLSPPPPLLSSLHVCSSLPSDRCHSITAGPSVSLNLITAYFKLPSRSKSVIPFLKESCFLLQLELKYEVERYTRIGS